MKIFPFVFAAISCWAAAAACAAVGAREETEPRPSQKDPDAIVANDYIRQASAQFSARMYLEFVNTCRRWEKIDNDFSASYNIALGLLYINDTNGSKAKLAEIQGRVLNTEQREKVDALRVDILLHESYVKTKPSVSAGSAILQHKNPAAVIESGQGERSSLNRSSASIGLKPEHSSEFMEGIQRHQLSQWGYMPPVKISSRPLGLAPIKEK